MSIFSITKSSVVEFESRTAHGRIRAELEEQSAPANNRAGSSAATIATHNWSSGAITLVGRKAIVVAQSRGYLLSKRNQLLF